MNTLLADFARDCRLATRAMRNKPAFSFFAVFTLALGIGASTTVFTVVNTLLLNPLPARDSSSLAALYATPSQGGGRSTALLPMSYLNLRDLAGSNAVFSSIGGYTQALPVTLTGGEGPQRIFAELVTRGYFETLGIRPKKGRFFLPDENTTPGSANVAVLSYGAWQTRFGGAEDILDRNLTIDGASFTVVGVAPSGFIGVSAVFGPDVWFPATMAQQLLPAQSRDALTERTANLFHAIARLMPGISRQRAAGDMQAAAASLARAYPQANAGRTISVEPIATELFSNAGGERALKFAGAGLMAIVGVILLIACSNVANLLLARTASRKHEISVRMAIGAGSGRVVRQLLAESLLLGLLGGVAGTAIAYAGCQLLWTLRPAEVAVNMPGPRIDGRVLLFMLVVSIGAGLLFGALPALRAGRTNMLEGLQEEARIAGVGRRGVTFANALLAGQVALSLILLTTAALFLRGVERARQIDPGFDAAHMALFMMNPGQAGYTPQRTKEFYRDLRDRLSAVPGVAAVSWASNMPFWSNPSRTLLVEGERQVKLSDRSVTVVNTVDADYLSTMQIPLIEGRDFNENDRDGCFPWPSSTSILRGNIGPVRARWGVGSVSRTTPSNARWLALRGL